MVHIFITKLTLLSRSGSQVKPLTWSLGICGLVSAYHLLSGNKLASEEEYTMREKISEVIVSELPSSLGLGLSPSAFTIAYRESVIGKEPQDMVTIAMSQVTGF